MCAARLARLRTGDIHAYAVQFSPYSDTRLAVAGGQHYGIAGAGQLLVFERRRNSVVSHDSDGVGNDAAASTIATAGESTGSSMSRRMSAAEWHVTRRFDWADGLFDCCWSEEHDNHVVTAGGDGGLQLWDLGLPHINGPIRAWREHTQEAYRYVREKM